MHVLASERPIRHGDMWKMDVVCDETGVVVRELVGYHFNDVMSQMKEFRAEAKKAVREAKSKKVSEISTHIADIIGNRSSMTDLSDKVDVADDSREAKLVKYEAKKKAIETSVSTKAKSLLVGLCQLYFTGEFIAQDDYIKSKISIESMTLESLMYQLENAKMMISKINESLFVDDSISARQIEVTGGLMKVVLDISKFQHEFIVDLEKRMKELKVEYDEISSNLPNETEDKDVVIISTRDKKKILDDLDEMLKDKNYKNNVPKSKNPNAVVLEDANFIDDKDDRNYLSDESIDDDGDDDGDDGNLGLGTFEHDE